jgi:S1-C subfamily serine protease
LPGLVGTESNGGLLIHAVDPDSFGERLGLETGDVLVELGGAAVFGPRELLFFMRSHQPGEVAEAAWAPLIAADT